MLLLYFSDTIVANLYHYRVMCKLLPVNLRKHILILNFISPYFLGPILLCTCICLHQWWKCLCLYTKYLSCNLHQLYSTIFIFYSTPIVQYSHQSISAHCSRSVYEVIVVYVSIIILNYNQYSVVCHYKMYSNIHLMFHIHVC